MTQPKYAPILSPDEVRPAYRLAPPRPWRAHRPGDFTPGPAPSGLGAGSQGPDQGYALRLARSFVSRLVLSEGEHPDDAIAGAVAIATRRAALFGRAPVASDIEFALVLFGFLDKAEVDLVSFRQPLFSGAGHHYWDQREIAHRVPVETLRRTPDEIRSDPSSWRALGASQS